VEKIQVDPQQQTSRGRSALEIAKEMRGMVMSNMNAMRNITLWLFNIAMV
jgi:hypothetical protein